MKDVLQQAKLTAECVNIVVAHRRGNYEIYKDIPRLDFKKSALPENRSVSSVSKEMGVAVVTINSWLAKLKNGTLSLEEDGGAGCRNANEKLNLLLEYQKVTAENEGEWLRQNGLHSEHLTIFKQELSEIVANRSDEKDKRIKELEKKLKETEKELLRKNDALAEMAALMMLKKKLDSKYHGITDEDVK